VGAFAFVLLTTTLSQMASPGQERTLVPASHGAARVDVVSRLHIYWRRRTWDGVSREVGRVPWRAPFRSPGVTDALLKGDSRHYTPFAASTLRAHRGCRRVTPRQVSVPQLRFMLSSTTRSPRRREQCGGCDCEGPLIRGDILTASAVHAAPGSRSIHSQTSPVGRTRRRDFSPPFPPFSVIRPCVRTVVAWLLRPGFVTRREVRRSIRISQSRSPEPCLSKHRVICLSTSFPTP